MTATLESIQQLFLAHSRSDQFKFLNLSDVNWKQYALEVPVTKTAPVMPAAFTQDPFAQLALNNGAVDEYRVLDGANESVFKIFTDFAQVYLLHVGKNASLELVVASVAAQTHFSRVHVVLEQNATLKLTLIQAHSLKGQIRAHIECAGEGANAQIHGLTVGKNKERQDLWVEAFHQVPHTQSELTAWCVVQDEAHSIFNGLVSISPSAPFTEANQRNKNLILSDRASVDTFPKLLISNNEVKCAHGSSVSTLDPDQTLYLQSRGINRAEAEKMITQGFVRQALDWIESKKIRAELNAVFDGLEIEASHEY